MIQQLTGQIHQDLPLLAPGVRQTDLLPAFYRLHGFARLPEGIFDFPGQILRVPELEENERLVVEVVLDAGRTRNNHGFTQDQILEDPRARISVNGLR